MSINKHTEAVILGSLMGEDETLYILSNRIADISADLVKVGRMVYDLLDQTNLDFRAELRKLLLLEEFSDYIKDLYWPNGLEAGINELTDAIIKDMHIEEVKN